MFPKLRLKLKPNLISLAGGMEQLPCTDPAMRATPLQPSEWREKMAHASAVNAAVDAGQPGPVGGGDAGAAPGVTAGLGRQARGVCCIRRLCQLQFQDSPSWVSVPQTKLVAVKGKT